MQKTLAAAILGSALLAGGVIVADAGVTSAGGDRHRLQT